MSEMLGNHYFNFRNYLLAEKTFERILAENYHNTSLLKKLSICYTQSQKINRALKLLNHLIEIDISLVLQGVKYDEDCPCNELIRKIENEYDINKENFDSLVILGVLWCYCNHKTALKYFIKAAELKPSNRYLKKIIGSLKSYSNKKQLQTS